MRTAGAEEACFEVRRLLAYSVSEDVDLVAPGDQLLGAMIGAERRAAGRVERLWNYLKYAHALHIPIRNESRTIDIQQLAKSRREEIFELCATHVAAGFLDIRRHRPRVAAQLDRPCRVDQPRGIVDPRRANAAPVTDEGPVRGSEEGLQVQRPNR